MKITVGEKKEGKPITTFPNVGISGSGNIVMFDERCQGIVLASPLTMHPVGSYRVNWAMREFVVYTEPITIQGEE